MLAYSSIPTSSAPRKTIRTPMGSPNTLAPGAMSPTDGPSQRRNLFTPPLRHPIGLQGSTPDARAPRMADWLGRRTLTGCAVGERPGADRILGEARKGKEAESLVGFTGGGGWEVGGLLEGGGGLEEVWKRFGSALDRKWRSGVGAGRYTSLVQLGLLCVIISCSWFGRRGPVATAAFLFSRVKLHYI